MDTSTDNKKKDVAAAGAHEATSAKKPAVTRPPRDSRDRPMNKLSVNLIVTYRHINEVYYANKRARKARAKKNNGYDDENNDYIVRIGELWNDRYEIRGLLGKGSFGQVVEAVDKETDTRVAVKIIKNKSAFREQARIEIELLKRVATKDPTDSYHMVRMLRWFEHKDHLCIVFELLSFNLYDLIRNTNFRGVSLNLIRKFAIQILRGLAFLSRDDISIIHCDLKPENILLRNPKRTALKLIDFGSSCYIGKTMYPYIQSRFYRSPEVLLGLPYDQAIDMWSLGCILFELHTGDPIFNGVSERDQVYKLTELLGVPPVHMLEKGRKAANFFRKLGDGSYELLPTKRTYLKPGSKSLSNMLNANQGGPGGRRMDEQGHKPDDYARFIDLLRGLLEYDPEKRLKAADALNHPFIVHADAASRRSDTAAHDAGSARAAGVPDQLARLNRMSNAVAKTSGRASV
ncbi:uncharacterized protein MONBRDRAFT_14418 [Monosiga brevicollis MX1]|uniref:dual-specificity kinase n=1 Tax=Monosiga brevicollis TaxID=81824 RepID=A9URA6_MONBE|nr:uncharacterized protein MONBRDRAFT_14418 [Monosiga brevicollis MX1]EDQ92209.1 predicted protein [Monosiga brevicollis MX1]|eukprot:XP_001743495.1 hypothetical protein [Monosiga brevicollis MX1]